MSVPAANGHQCLRLTLHGLVQGVGFRPFVCRLASEMHLTGWVKNSAQGLLLEVEGPLPKLNSFLSRLQNELPDQAVIESFESAFLNPKHHSGFQILESEKSGQKSAWILPDLAPCKKCLQEIFDPGNRRYRYPFTNCTHCGPRYSIMEAMPYDRANTSMKKFKMCAECSAEYYDPEDRRFHAQPNACPECGPRLSFWDARGKTIFSQDDALKDAVRRLKAGAIIAVKGVGGFHLMADAGSEDAVLKLRARKHRGEKPFALMAPDLPAIENVCEVSEIEKNILTSAQAPIVLLKRRSSLKSFPVSESVAPGNPYWGVMLPSSPLHALLMSEMGSPVVATSGNISEEPIVTDEREALSRLSGIADFYLVHDRPIVRHSDDSIVLAAAGRPMILRRARGYAPLSVAYCEESADPMLAVGAHLKNTVAQSLNGQIFMSQHLGDLDTAKSYEAFLNTIHSFQKLYAAKPAHVASDLHPDYASSGYAGHCHLPHFKIQHHYAHALSGMADNELRPPLLAVCWDGAGLGTDGTVWGGEFLKISETGFNRAGHFRKFRLLGGDQAAKEPRRAAWAVLYEIFGEAITKWHHLKLLKCFSKNELHVFQAMLSGGAQSPWTTSAGRFFDAASALIGIRNFNQYEGQAASELEFAAGRCKTTESYPIWIAASHAPSASRPRGQMNPETENKIRVFDWEPVVRKMMGDFEDGVSTEFIAAKFHNTLAEVIVSIAKSVNEEKVLLTGGCFQNRYLLEKSIEALRTAGFEPYWHQRIPTNDGGISVGQIYGAWRELHKQEAERMKSSCA